MNQTIDFHHHATPPEYVKIQNKYGVEGNTGVKFKKFNPVKNLHLIEISSFFHHHLQGKNNKILEEKK